MGLLMFMLAIICFAAAAFFGYFGLKVFGLFATAPSIIGSSNTILEVVFLFFALFFFVMGVEIIKSLFKRK